MLVFLIPLTLAHVLVAIMAGSLISSGIPAIQWWAAAPIGLIAIVDSIWVYAMVDERRVF